MVISLIEDKALWDKFIDESPYSTLFQKWEFLKIIEKHSGHKLYPYGIYKGEEPICLFPLFIKSHMGLKTVFSPPPKMAVPYLGFVMAPVYDTLKQHKKETYLNSAMDEMESEIKKLQACYINISTVNRFVDVRPFKWNGYNVQMHYTNVVDLKRPLEAIWGGFDQDIRLDIGNAEKLQLSVRPADDINEFYRIMQDRHKQQGLNPPISREYLKDVLEAFPDNVKANFLYNGDKIVDSVVYYQYNKRLVFWIRSTGSGNGVHSSEYFVWNFIKNKKAEGLDTLEIQGGNGKALCLDRSKFNASLEYNFSITKKNMTGNIAEWMYMNLLNKNI